MENKPIRMQFLSSNFMEEFTMNRNTCTSQERDDVMKSAWARGEMVIHTTPIAGQNIMTLVSRKELMKTIKLLRHSTLDTKATAASLRKELPGNSQDLHDDIHMAMAYKFAAGGAKGGSLLEDAGISCMAILVDVNAEEKPMVERGGFSTSFLRKHAHPTMRTEAIGRVRS